MTVARIVVGVDDSVAARHALAWAIDEAVLLGAELDVVHCYQTPVTIVPPTMLARPTTSSDAKARAHALVGRLASEALARAARRPAPSRRSPPREHPASSWPPACNLATGWWSGRERAMASST